MAFTSYSHMLCYIQMAISIPVLLMQPSIDKSTLIKVGVLGILMVLIFSDGVDVSMVNTMIMLVIVSQYPFDKTIRIYVLTTGLIVATFTLLYFLGIVTSTDNVRDGVVRISYGFNHANIYAQFILSTYLGYVYIRHSSIKWFDILIGVVLSVWIFIGPNSRTSCLLVLAGIFLAIIIKWCNHYHAGRISSVLFRLFLVTPILLLIFTMTASVLYRYDIGILNWLNQFITGRITMQSEAYGLVGFPLLGMTGNGWVTPYFLDNAYYSMILRFGLVFVIVYLMLFTRIHRVVKPQQRLVIGGIIAIMAFFGLLQAKYLEIFVNPFLLLLFVPEENL